MKTLALEGHNQPFSLAKINLLFTSWETYMSEKPTIRPSELKDINNSFCHIVAPAIELPIYVEDDPPFSIYI